MKLSIIIYFLLLVLSATMPLQSQYRRILSEKQVYFFGPSIEEVDSLKDYTAGAINDFSTYTNKIVPFLKLNGIKTNYLSDRKIEFQVDSINTLVVYRDSVDFGTILTDGKKQPKVLKFVLTDIELKEEIEIYYKLK
jgi:hypothetical protein